MQHIPYWCSIFLIGAAYSLFGAAYSLFGAIYAAPNKGKKQNYIILVSTNLKFADDDNFEFCCFFKNNKLEDLKVLKRSPDLLNNVKIGQDRLQLIMKHILFYGGCCHFGQVT